MTKTPEVISTVHFMCRGITKDKKFALGSQNAEPIITVVYRDGSTDVYCRYLDGGWPARCNAADYADDILKNGSGFCPYDNKG